MKRVISSVAGVLVLLVLVGAGVKAYTYYFPKPCTKPILYRVGELDERFGVSRESFLSAVEDASAIWEQVAGINFFEYSPKGKLVVNLIYDERQRETQEQQTLEDEISRSQLLYKTKRSQLESLQIEYQRRVAEYEAMLNEFKVEFAEFQSDVMYWNRRGGASGAKYNELQRVQRDVLELHRALEEKRLSLNALASDVNALVTEVNRLAREVNGLVNDYNSGDLVGTRFDQGLYIRDAYGISINIYQFTDRKKLVRVIAHEFGHALGLDHTEDPNSIMYELNQGENEKLSSEDVTVLQELCNQ